LSAVFLLAENAVFLLTVNMLTMGAANLMKEYASEEIKNKFLKKLCQAEWQGTMALTEPNVGSSLGDLTTSAEETAEGYYRIKGQKIFISAADTDQVENTVHMLLARIKGAPAGAKGISLFVVPKYRINDDGHLEFNDVTCGGIEHKMGYKGSPICQLILGEKNDCRGYLVGEPGKGLAYMFSMMNEERVNIGIGAVGKATAAYYAALDYAQQRLQGRRISDKDPNSPMIPIIEHPDIKRMLLFQRAICEGALSLCLQASKYLDIIKVTDDPEEKERCALLFDLLIPVVKTYPSEMGILSTSAAIQCLGGYGYCQDFPVEQYYRDIRIDPIHEGTTGIQAQDILGRKVTMKNGQAFIVFLEEVNKVIQEAQNYPNLKSYGDALAEAVNLLQDVTKYLVGLAEEGKKDEFLADATLYLELFGIVAIAWQWLIQGIAALKAMETNNADNDQVFYKGKLYTCRYFYSYELPKILGLAHTLKNTGGLTVEMDTKYLLV
jgi:alkylation response protein AidB-like acyl-CoA dehydrogenase